MTAPAFARDQDWQRLRVARAALRWIGTPFHHAARIRGVGVDCAQLLIAVYALECRLVEAPEVPAYGVDWFLHTDRDYFGEWLTRYAAAVDRPALGDIALFRYGRGLSHAAIVVATAPELQIVHAFRGVGVVLDTVAPTHALAARLGGYWRLRRWLEAA